LSVDALQLRLIWLLDVGVTVRPEGLVGGWVSGVSVVALATPE